MAKINRRKVITLPNLQKKQNQSHYLLANLISLIAIPLWSAKTEKEKQKEKYFQSSFTKTVHFKQPYHTSGEERAAI